VQLTNTLAVPGNVEGVSKQAGQMVDLFCNTPSAQASQATCYSSTGEYVTPPNQSLVITSVDITGSSAATYAFILASSTTNLNQLYRIGR
jgi:hypothetical protein